MKDDWKFFITSLMVRKFLGPLLLNLGKLCDCFDRKKTVEVTSCLCPTPGIKSLVDSTSCFLEFSLLGHCLWQSSHQAVRSPNIDHV